jgi:hypothetical protein
MRQKKPRRRGDDMYSRDFPRWILKSFRVSELAAKIEAANEAEDFP